MLYKMSTEGSEFDAVLKEAQEKGYAEADPTADVEGYDACRKIAILSSLAYGKFLNYEEIYTEGITKVTPEDMEYAAELGMTVKLLATSRKVGNDSFLCDGSSVPSGQKQSAVQRQRSIQQCVCTWKCSWRRHVLWKRRRQAANSKRCCG